MTTLHVSFFAAFRDQTGVSEQTVTTNAVSARELFDELRSTFTGLEAYVNMKFAVNDEMVDADYVLRDNDRVLFFPPVAGG
ncbi:MAG: MoaD/ThiS family protein [Gammaproteobacteria bacterium]